MFVSHVTMPDLEYALERVNALFGDNLKIVNLRTTTRDQVHGYLLSLLTRHRGVLGSRTTEFGNPTNRACWHAVGEFIDALPSQAHVEVGNGIDTMPGYPWIDIYGTRSYNKPHYKMLCECEPWTPYFARYHNRKGGK